MMLLAQDAAEFAIPQYPFDRKDIVGGGSTDMGDLSCVMPVVHPYAKGASGTSHGADYYITDPIAACVDCAKWQLGMLLLLLQNNAERANKIIEEFNPMFKTKEEFLNYVDSINCSGDRITYNEDNSVAEIKID